MKVKFSKLDRTSDTSNLTTKPTLKKYQKKFAYLPSKRFRVYWNPKKEKNWVLTFLYFSIKSLADFEKELSNKSKTFSKLGPCQVACSKNYKY